MAIIFERVAKYLRYQELNAAQSSRLRVMHFAAPLMDAVDAPLPRANRLPALEADAFPKKEI